MAASDSCVDDIVSIHNRSAPPSLRACACSENAVTASLWLKLPIGSGISPVGPIEPAIITGRPALSATLRPILTPATFSSCTWWAAL